MPSTSGRGWEISVVRALLSAGVKPGSEQLKRSHGQGAGVGHRGAWMARAAAQGGRRAAGAAGQRAGTYGDPQRAAIARGSGQRWRRALCGVRKTGVRDTMGLLHAGNNGSDLRG